MNTEDDLVRDLRKIRYKWEKKELTSSVDRIDVFKVNDLMDSRTGGLMESRMSYSIRVSIRLPCCYSARWAGRHLSQ